MTAPVAAAAAAAPEVPWSAVISGAVGIAGIAGSVLTAYLTNKAAERRMRLQQDYEDGRRFHKERLELYGKLLAAVEAYRVRAIGLRVEHDKRAEDARKRGQLFEEMKLALSDLAGAAKAAELIGAPNTRKAASVILKPAAKLMSGALKSDEEFTGMLDKLREASTEFADAARAEFQTTGASSESAPEPGPERSVTSREGV